MKHHICVVDHLSGLQTFLEGEAIQKDVKTAQSILIQVLSAQTDPNWLEAVSHTLMGALPTAVIVGSTTIGEIAHGRTYTGSTVISVSIFSRSALLPFAEDCPTGKELRLGRRLGRAVKEMGADVRGVLLLITTANVDSFRVLQGVAETNSEVPIFGGGAGDYSTMTQSRVVFNDRLISQGVVAVAFAGKDLHIEPRTYLGWLPLSKKMTVTEVEGMDVKTIDGAPAFEVYRRYLDIKNDSRFFLNAMEFPLLIERGDSVLARSPVSADPNGALKFIADIVEGDVLRVGYGDPATIVTDAVSIQKIMQTFSPEGVYLYSCCCRRFLMQDDVEMETLPFQNSAPTVGFYTYGELFGRGQEMRLLNSTMVAVGIREGQGRVVEEDKPEEFTDMLGAGSSNYRHVHLVSRLVHFIGAVAAELEQVNNELMVTSITDKLTQLNNRGKLDAALSREMNRANRYQNEFSVILLDIDHFKQVNDLYGHHTGDEVLIRIAEILRRTIRSTDIPGRWGGEEFMIILPHTSPQRAKNVAEKIRKAVAAATFPLVGHKTASFGVTGYCPGDTEFLLHARVDEALYEAKNAGRNKVVMKLIDHQPGPPMVMRINRQDLPA